ncbi:MAG TPA: phosphotransferase [Roseiflexaceae bacterium]|nr:phosphotransferase [Roseiflexaceae bacterium]
MSTTTGLLETGQRDAILAGLRRFMEPPAWLGPAGHAEPVRAALERQVPEFASGALAIRELVVKRMRLKKGQGGWTGQYELSVAAPGAEPRAVMLFARLIPPGLPEPDLAGAQAAFGEPDWRCYLPDLRLELQTQPADPALPALPLLTDPAQARELLERGIRACSPAYADISIQSCTIKHLRYKPGSRATVVYELKYAPEHAARNWPPIVVAKTYSGSKGQNAYDGMAALWASPLASGDLVTIAEPLAYLPDLKVLVQGPIYEEQTLEDLLKASVKAGTPEALGQLDEYMRKTAAGLAALHQSGVSYGETITWEDELAEVREVIERLASMIPSLADAAESLLQHLELLAAETPPDPALPAHRAFRPAQVLIHQGKIGFIDFDGFGQSEPALDLSRFTRKTRALGLDVGKVDPNSPSGLERLAQMEAICEEFLGEYEQRVPVSRRRIALWEALDLLTLVLYCWTKIEPERLNSNMLLLERHLKVSGLLNPA